MKEIQIGLIGFGTVGSGLAEVLLDQQQRLQKRTGLSIRLAKVADIRIDKLPPRFADVPLTRDANELFNDPNIDIVVELIGGITAGENLPAQGHRGRQARDHRQQGPDLPGGLGHSPQPPPGGWKSASRPASAAASR